MAEIKSIAQLIEMKEQISKDKTEVKEMYIESIDSYIKFKPASRVEIVQAQKFEQEDIDPMMVLNHVVEPNLKDQRLQDAFNKNCQPHLIVDKIFGTNEVGKISRAICGLEKVTLHKEVKN